MNHNARSATHTYIATGTYLVDQVKVCNHAYRLDYCYLVAVPGTLAPESFSSITAYIATCTGTYITTRLVNCYLVAVPGTLAPESFSSITAYIATCTGTYDIPLYQVPYQHCTR